MDSQLKGQPEHRQPRGAEQTMPHQDRQGHGQGQDRYGKLSDDVSRVLRNIVLTLLVIAILSQWMLRSDAIRHHVTNAEKLEGTPFRQGSRALH